MRKWLVLASLVVLGVVLWVRPAVTGPRGGPKGRERIDLPAGKPGKKQIKVNFVAGERACVILQGDHAPVADLGIEIYDDNRRLLARDDGKGDFAAVEFYPPTDGEYTIVLQNNQAEYNECYLVIK